MSVSEALVSNTFTMHVYSISCNPMESCLQSWKILTIFQSTMTFLSTFLASQKASKSPNQFMCQMSMRKVFLPLFNCTIQTKPPRRRRPSRSTPRTELLRMCAAQRSRVQQLKISQDQPYARGQHFQRGESGSYSLGYGVWQGQGHCSRGKGVAMPGWQMSWCMGKLKKAWPSSTRCGLAWLIKFPLLFFNDLLRNWKTSCQSRARLGSSSFKNFEAKSVTVSTEHSAIIFSGLIASLCYSSSGMVSFSSFKRVLMGGIPCGILAVYIFFFRADSSISPPAIASMKNLRQTSRISSRGALRTKIFCFSRVLLQYLLWGGLSQRYPAIWLNFTSAIKILLKPTLLNSLWRRASVRGAPGQLAWRSYMNSSQSRWCMRVLTMYRAGFCVLSCSRVKILSSWKSQRTLQMRGPLMVFFCCSSLVLWQSQTTSSPCQGRQTRSHTPWAKGQFLAVRTQRPRRQNLQKEAFGGGGWSFYIITIFFDWIQKLWLETTSEKARNMEKRMANLLFALCSIQQSRGLTQNILYFSKLIKPRQGRKDKNYNDQMKSSPSSGEVYHPLNASPYYTLRFVPPRLHSYSVRWYGDGLPFLSSLLGVYFCE